MKVKYTGTRPAVRTLSGIVFIKNVGKEIDNKLGEKLITREDFEQVKAGRPKVKDGNETRAV